MINCTRIDCLHFSNESCTRDEILIDKSKIDGEEVWICKCFSNLKISGHTDWLGRFTKPDGTAKGYNIDDSYADKMYKDSLKLKSFRDNTRMGKEPKRKK